MMKNAYPKRIAKFSFLAFLGLASLVGCEQNEEVEPENSDINSLVVPGSFNYNTTQSAQVTITALDAKKAPIKLPFVQIFDKDPEDGGRQLFVGGMDANGVLSTTISIPTSLKTVLVKSNYIGLPHAVEVPVTNGKISYTLAPASSGSRIAVPGSANLRATAEWDKFGVPTNLAAQNEWNRAAITASTNSVFLADINATLPEGRRTVNGKSMTTAQLHPEYISSTMQADVEVSKPAEVWVTFVHEGAAFTNTLGYYTYDLASPPTSVAQIEDRKKYVFPNASLPNALGVGNLTAGATVKIGPFPAGTGIGFFLIVGGWDKDTETVEKTGPTDYRATENRYTIYSNPAFNPEANPDLKRHTVLFKDDVRDVLVLGFEDRLRQSTAGVSTVVGDEDFNDAMFIVSSNPMEAVLGGNFPKLTPSTTDRDTDSDGVKDSFDGYPNDVERAYNNYASGSLAFEDKWPSKGDFDMNDLVIDYNYQLVTNAANKTKDIKGTYSIKAVGAARHNGFGVELPFAKSEVSSVSGSTIEAANNQASFVVFDDVYDLLPSTSFFNTEPTKEMLPAVNTSVSVTLKTPIALNQQAPFNPFLIVDGNRGSEVHLPGSAPTSLANVALFGTADDNTSIGGSVYYKTKDNLPFAIHVATTFEHPIEKAKITDTYLKFADWARSGGVNSLDWYSNVASGYRNASKIFKK